MAEVRPVSPTGRLRVLIVEDEPRLRELLVDELPRMGFDAVAARTAEQATRVMQEQPCHIVILDLTLPVMDGMSFLRRLRERGIDVPVIILTGFGDLDAAKRAIDHDVVSFLTKPCRLGELDTALARARERLMEKAVSLATTGAAATAAPPAGDDESAEGAMAASDDSEPLALAEIERRAILQALRRHAGNRSAAAAELGISRRTLYNRLDEYERRGQMPDDVRRD